MEVDRKQCIDPARGRFFAGFTSSLPFQYSVMFIVRLNRFQITPLLFGLSSFRYLSFRDFGCGKAMSSDDLSEKIGLTRQFTLSAAKIAIPRPA
jgi:hypothetical protein